VGDEGINLRGTKRTFLSEVWKEGTFLAKKKEAEYLKREGPIGGE